MLLVPLLAALVPAQGAVRALPQEDEYVYYDYLTEDGVLTGGRVRVDANDPMLAEVGPRRSLRVSSFSTIVDNGPHQNRVDIVYVGDGYQEAELGLYESDVLSSWSYFVGQHPISAYSSYFNVHRVDVVSVDSGVDHDPTLGILKNTALDMGFWTSGIERLLGVDQAKAQSHAAAAPDVDLVFAVANSTKYGGAGYTGVATVAGGNYSAGETTTHEFGHSFANLADEYEYGGPTTFTMGEPQQKNATIFKKHALINKKRKWYRWLDLPNVDSYEGAMQSYYGVYRPTYNSKMRSLWRPFEEVNSERIVRCIYVHVDPIEAVTPQGVYSDSDTLSVTPMQPTYHDLDIQWRVNGFEAPGGKKKKLDLSKLGLPAGVYTVSLTVRDETEMVRDEGIREGLMTSRRYYTVVSGGAHVHKPQLVTEGLSSK